MFINVKIDNLYEISNEILKIVNIEVRIKDEIIKIKREKKYLLISFFSKLIFKKKFLFKKTFLGLT